MRAFLVEYIDALITTASGVFACFVGYGSRRGAPSTPRAIKVLRICGPLLIVFGLMRFVTDFSAAPQWQRCQTSDGVASAEFPAEPKAFQQTDANNGTSVRRSGFTYDVPYSDISLFLSFSPLPPEELTVSGTRRIGGVEAYFIQQGWTVLREVPMQLGAASGFALDLERNAGKTLLWARICYVDGKIYRAIASSSSTLSDHPVISHFLESFRIEKTGK